MASGWHSEAGGLDELPDLDDEDEDEDEYYGDEELSTRVRRVSTAKVRLRAAAGGRQHESKYATRSHSTRSSAACGL